MTLQDLHLSAHAVEQYIERVRPALAFDVAKRELETLLAAHGRVVANPPSWTEPHVKRVNFGWVLIGDDVALPIAATRTLSTCIVPGTRHPNKHRARRARKARRREIERYRGDTDGGVKSRDRRRARTYAPIHEEADRVQ